MEVENMEDWCYEDELKTYLEQMQWIKEIDVIGINDFKYPRNGFGRRRTELVSHTTTINICLMLN